MDARSPSHVGVVPDAKIDCDRRLEVAARRFAPVRAPENIAHDAALRRALEFVLQFRERVLAKKGRVHDEAVPSLTQNLNQQIPVIRAAEDHVIWFDRFALDFAGRYAGQTRPDGSDGYRVARLLLGGLSNRTDKPRRRIGRQPLDCIAQDREQRELVERFGRRLVDA